MIPRVRHASKARGLALGALLSLASCDAPLAATEVVARIDSDLAPGSELTRVEAHVFDVDDAREELGSADFALAGVSARTGYALPLSFSIAPQGARSSRSFRLVVAGYGRPAPDLPEALQVERQVVTSFRSQRSLRLDVFLGRICLGVLCRNDGAGAPLTCGDDGRCGAVPVVTDLPELGEPVPASQPAAANPPADAGTPAPQEDAGASDGEASLPDATLAGDDAGSDPPDAGPTPDAGCVSASCCPVGYRATTTGCVDLDECADSTINTCNPSSLCAQTVAPGYTCTGQFADWPMPDTALGNRGTAPAYSFTTDTVRDEVTGLVWQRLIDANTYRTFAGADGYCGGLGLGGFDDWRVPSRIELASLLDTMRSPPLIDTVAFPGSPSAGFWARESGASASQRWGLSFGDATNRTYGTADTLLVRCVRSGSVPSGSPATRYAVDPSAGTVTDTRTGLIWQRGVNATPSSYEAALATCSSRGTRLPTLKELLTLVDPTRTMPALDTAFPPFPPRAFWTASSIPGTADQVYIVGFDQGNAAPSSTASTLSYAVRCVGPL